MKRVIIRVLLAAAGIFACGIAYVFLKYFLWMPVVSKGEPLPGYDAEKAAVLVIDIQEGTSGALSKGKGLVAQSGPFIETVNGVIARAEADKIPVIYIRQVNTDPVFRAFGFLAKGTPAIEIDKRVRIISPTVFDKQKMDAFSNPALDAFLRQNEISRLYVTGLDAAYCVDRTIKGALNRGYKVTAVKDAIISSTAENRDRFLKSYEAEGVTLTDAAGLKI